MKFASSSKMQIPVCANIEVVVYYLPSLLINMAVPVSFLQRDIAAVEERGGDFSPLAAAGEEKPRISGEKKPRHSGEEKLELLGRRNFEILGSRNLEILVRRSLEILGRRNLDFYWGEET